MARDTIVRTCANQTLPRKRYDVQLTQYGSPAWNAEWARLCGDGEITWGPDPRLTPLGKAQARAVNAAWKAARQRSDAPPLPELFCSSPLYRSLHTADLSWEGVCAPTFCIYENLREVCGRHTCDKRSTKAALARTAERELAAPHLVFEPGFADDDPLWTVGPVPDAAGARVGRRYARPRPHRHGLDLAGRRARCARYVLWLTQSLALRATAE